ncbi:MAG: hypothetical protein JEZ03_14335 [Bacteroidales bacterium]|nr:hypothetical protein [Bacteroidales bacterium]
MNKFLTIILVFMAFYLKAQESKIFPGADEKSPSRAQFFTWINNTNEGATEEQTLINLEFFKWLQDEYGMVLDIYAFDAGAIDGKRFYGDIHSNRFNKQFPNGFDPIYEKAKSMGTRLGVWGGPDGFGNTPDEEQKRINQMVKLCKDYEFALFKFDAVCGPLRPEKEDAFIQMMKECREYSPDLILLNHRLGLDKAKPYATTFLWEGWETYIDVFMTNNVTAPHHRAGALSRGLVPDLQRLTEDHGVCISSCPDNWDDDLILQAFNRCLILAPEVYGNPWLLNDDEFSKLARIYNLHKKYRDIMVDGILLPKEQYGPSAVSRGDKNNRLITLRNLSWKSIFYKLNIGEELGLTESDSFEVRVFHPYEEVLGDYIFGQEVEIEVLPFRSCLVLISSDNIAEPAIVGAKYEVVKNVEGKTIEIDVLALPGTKANINLKAYEDYKSAKFDDKDVQVLLNGKGHELEFEGEKITQSWHRKLGVLDTIPIPEDVSSLYEATVFAADNNALEVRSLIRSGETSIPQVKAARDAFFNQEVFTERGIWDQNLFDGNMQTAFWPSHKYSISQRVKGGCFRLDLGEIREVDSIIIRVPDEYSLQPYLRGEGNYADVSSDLISWKEIVFLAGKEMKIEINNAIRYLRLDVFPDRISEIEVWKDNDKISSKGFRASNLFARPSYMNPVKSWKLVSKVDQIYEGSYLCIAINGEHGKEGAYAGVKIDGEFYGCPDRASSFPSNTWEFVNSGRDKNYTYYFPLEKWMEDKVIEVYVMAYEEGKIDLLPELWLTSNPAPFVKKRLLLERK